MNSAETLELIRDLSNVYGPSGFEEEVCEVVKKNSEGLKFYKDAMKNVYLLAAEYDENKPTVMLDAHLDEVGFMVQSIDAKGMLGIIALGGWNVSSLPTHKIKIRNADGEYITGIISSKPSHLSSSSEAGKKLEFEDLRVDLGAVSRDEVINDFKIELGAPAVPCTEFEYNEKNGVMCGKAFDNRMGCAALIKTMRSLIGKELPINVVGALAVQEEVGTRGAQVTAFNVKPDIAIVFEGTPADDVYTDQYTCQGGLKKGPQLRHRDNSFIASPDLMKFAKKVGRENNIMFQEAVRRGGGTDSGKIQLTGKGVPVVVIGIPARYIHSHFCFSSMLDFELSVELALKMIDALDVETVKSIRNVEGI